jgi:hypothetical protein
LHPCYAGVPFVPDVLNVGGLHAIARIPGFVGLLLLLFLLLLSSVPSIPAFSGVPSVAGVPAVAGIIVLLLASTPAYPGVPILAMYCTGDILSYYRTTVFRLLFFLLSDYRNIECLENFRSW